MKKAIITGANGQLGQFLINKFLNEGIEVIGTIRHKSFDEQELIFDKSKVTIELLDLLDATSVENLVIRYKPDYFINTAASAFVADSWTLPEQYFQFNTLGVLKQLEAIRKHSPKTRYLNMGTSEEFAVSEITRAQNEDTKIAPKSPYGCSKAAARYIVDVYRESYNMYALQPWTFNFESSLRGYKYLTRKCSSNVARIKKEIDSGLVPEPMELGNMDSYRSWQFAGDVADGIFRMVNQEKYREMYLNEDLPYEKDFISRLKNYVFSEDQTHSVREFVEKAFDCAGIKGVWMGKGLDERYLLVEPIEDKDKGKEICLVQINQKFYRPADVTYLYGDASEARKDLGWGNTVDFDELVKSMVENDIKLLDKSQSS